MHDATVTDGIANESVLGATRCVVRLKPGLAPTAYEGYDASLYDKAMERTDRFIDLVSQVSQKKNLMIQEGTDRDVTTISLNDQIRSRQNAQNQLETKYTDYEALLSSLTTSANNIASTGDSINATRAERDDWRNKANDIATRATTKRQELANAQADPAPSVETARSAQLSSTRSSLASTQGNSYLNMNMQAVYSETDSACASRDCSVSDWGSCSASCGGGVQSRSVLYGKTNNGRDCPNLQQSCNTHSCPAPPPPPPPPPRSQYIKSRNRGNYCLDVSGISFASGAEVYMWDCWNGPNQRWTYDNKNRLVSENSGMCLDVWGGDPNTAAEIKQYPCHDGANQRWINDGGMLKPAHAPGMCLDIWEGRTDNGAAIKLYPCHGNANQRFDFY